MPPFNGPVKERDMYSARFIRVKHNIFVSEPDDESINHRELAESEGILGDIEKLKETHPRDVDAGKIFVYQGEITVAGNSWTLGLPDKIEKDEARRRTIMFFEEKSPNSTVYRSDI